MLKKLWLCPLISLQVLWGGVFEQIPFGVNGIPKVEINIPDIKVDLSPEFHSNLVRAFLASGKQFNENMLETFKTIGAHLHEINPGIVNVGIGLAEAAKPLRNVIVGSVLATTGIITAAVIINRVCAKYIAKYLYEPKLIQKKSSFWDKKSPDVNDISSSMVIDDRLRDQLNYLIATTKNIKKNGGFYDHALLYGLPGTGKTLFVELLAKCCEMEYAFIPGANVSQFLAKGTAVQELNTLFEWAEKSKRGVILFFDEAETFLAHRDKLNLEAQNALNAFLAKTGTPSNKFMIICATNRPEILDPAVKSRLGMLIHFPLPDLQARKDQLTMHINSIFSAQQGTRVEYSCLQNPEFVEVIAQRLEGCSGRFINQFVNKVRQYALAQNCLTLDQAFVLQVLEQSMKRFADTE